MPQKTHFGGHIHLTINPTCLPIELVNRSLKERAVFSSGLAVFGFNQGSTMVLYVTYFSRRLFPVV
jgi:predicted esterase